MLQYLNLKKSQVDSYVSGIGDTNKKMKCKARTTIRSLLNSFQTELDFWMLLNITSVQPEHDIDISSWEIPENITLADPCFNKAQKIELLIGADIFFEILSVGQIRLGIDVPIFQKTLLGWIVAGRYKARRDRYKTMLNVIQDDADRDELQSLHELVQKFWEMEDVVTKSNIYSAEQAECEDIFVKNVKQLDTGRLMVKLPFKISSQKLGDSIDNAKRRLQSIENRLSKNFEIKTQYAAFLSEYLTSEHMESILWEHLPESHYFMPHQFVLRLESSTTKLRVVFDASCKTST